VTPGGFSVKPSEVAIPAGETLGQFRRSIQPFRNWTLICDESLTAQRSVCNITQTVVDAAGAPAFSWSLLATEDGAPLMMMRAPAALGVGAQIDVALGAQEAVVAQTDRCDAAFCYATVAIGDMMRRHIQAATASTVTYAAGGVVTQLQAPLDGLYEALGGLAPADAAAASPSVSQ
jgi:invasion protein IalB